MSLPIEKQDSPNPFKKLYTTQYTNKSITKPHCVHLTSYDDCQILYNFKLLFQMMTMVDLNQKLWAQSLTPEIIIIIVTPYEVIDHQQTDGTSKCHERRVTTYTLLLQNKLRTNTENMYVATVKKINILCLLRIPL